MEQLPPSDASTIQVGLDCKVPTKLAWDVLQTGATAFVAVDDQVVVPCLDLLNSLDPPLPAGESAVAGLAAVVAAASQSDLRAELALNSDSRVVVIVCEGPTKL